MSTQPTGTNSSHWERQTIQKLLLEHVVEQRRARRWNLFFKILVVMVIAYFLIVTINKELPQPVMLNQAHTALIDINGEIDASQQNNADNIRDSLKSAFENKNVKGVIIRINSPGGSPVQSRHIFDEIWAYRLKYPKTKVYATIEEIGTSAAYLVACASDAIYADQTSLVGSIGVKIDSFGFVDAMHKFGVERRLYTAGKFKGSLDPFSPRNPAEDVFITHQLDLVHKAFINNVRQGRGDRLKEAENPDIFSGQFWVGEDALKLGLIDGFGDAYFVAREIIKAPNLVDYSPSSTIFDRLANRLGASVAQSLRRANFY